MSSDCVLELRHRVEHNRPCHDVAGLLKEFSLSDAPRARIKWSSGLALRNMQAIVSRGIGRFGYVGYIGTRVEDGELYVYKKAAYDPVLLSTICVGPMANRLGIYMSNPSAYERQLNGLGMFCRWVAREKLFERIARATLIEHGSVVKASLSGMTGSEIEVIMTTLSIMQFDRSIHTSGKCVFIYLNKEEPHEQH